MYCKIKEALPIKTISTTAPLTRPPLILPLRLRPLCFYTSNSDFFFSPSISTPSILPLRLRPLRTYPSDLAPLSCSAEWLGTVFVRFWSQNRQNFDETVVRSVLFCLWRDHFFSQNWEPYAGLQRFRDAEHLEGLVGDALSRHRQKWDLLWPNPRQLTWDVS